MSFVGSNVEQLLAALTEVMGVANHLGLSADAEHFAPERLVWVVPKEGHLSYQTPRVQPADGVVFQEELALFNVSVTAPSQLAADELRHRLLAGLEDLLGPLEYRLGQAREARGDELDHAAHGLVLPITLFRPVYSERYVDFALEETALSGVVENGSQQEYVINEQ